MSAGRAVLTAHVASFSYDGATPLLRDIRLALGEGSLTAILGASGSGTSTLAKILAGWAVAPGRGRFEGHLGLGPEAPGARLTFRGRPDDPRLSLGAWGQHVAYVPQRAADLLTGAAVSVGEELAFALEQRAVPRGPMRERVREAACAVGLGDHLERDPSRLSGGEQRRLALACAIVGRPSVLVLDDPSASLDGSGRMALGSLIDGLRAEGVAVVVAGACADRLARSADEAILLDGGTAAAEGTPEAVFATEAFARSGVLPTDPADEDGVPLATAAVGHARGTITLARLERVSFSYPGSASRVLDGADLEVRAGEVLALTGPNGAGKSTALRHLAGLARAAGGRVLVAGADIAGMPAGRVAAAVGTLFQEPRDQLFERTAAREVAFGLRLRVPGSIRLGRTAARTRAGEALEAVGLAGSAGTHPYDLSASGQRLLALATVLARAPRVLLLDEPTVGLDRHGLARLEAVVAAAAEGGAAVVLSTHALGWARLHAHRVLSLKEGRFAPA
ncbi:ABC transporter ATP-binding protein [Sinomonas cellulolyticus]|uniref:ATP-binding cassette domain-containing protein n=1 Tax=Sinomonas cellulolyticus TaxID=2801916 RepID=A0ABS1K1M4_9MICC|nr:MULTISPECIES: ABC transporter ATP-binding protein [Sinomonas]MBL0705430.1 ATP-binding cassette domain-containing protein [Sinomonas cellulolyticus]